LLFEKDGQGVCLIHIPRCGGRHVISLLKKNEFRYSENCKRAQESVFYRSTEYMHLTYDMLQEIHPEANDAKKIVIIRNPVDRFMSAVNSEWSIDLYFEGYENFYLMDDPLYFKYIMKEKKYSIRTKGRNFNFDGLSNTFTNWFRPQVEFFNKDFYIWKFENGFEDEFIQFLNKKVNLDININVKDVYTKTFYDEKIEGFSLSNELKENVLNFYKEDYEFWKQF
jgi:hypothetical protein